MSTSKKKKKLRRLQRRNQIKMQRIEAQKASIIFQDSTPAVAAACADLPKSIYADTLRKVVGKILHDCQVKALHLMGNGVKDSTDALVGRLRDRLIGVAEQHEANVNRTYRVEVLPENCRFVQHTDTCSIYVIEQKPQVRTLYFSNDIAAHVEIPRMISNKKEGDRYKVALPYVVFLVRLTGGRFEVMKVFYRTRPLTHLEDELFHTNLPNVHPNENSVCVGYDVAFFNSCDPPTKQVSDVIKHFWGSMFNTDLSESYFAMAKNDYRLANLQTWVQSSASDPMFVLNVPWRREGNVRTQLNSAVPSGIRNDTVNMSRAAVALAVEELDLLLKQTLEMLKSTISYNEPAAESGFQESLREAVFQAAKGTIDHYKRKLEKTLKKANEEREIYIKLANRDKAIKETLDVRPWPGGNW
jgi:hypothetical protein